MARMDGLNMTLIGIMTTVRVPLMVIIGAMEGAMLVGQYRLGLLGGSLKPVRGNEGQRMNNRVALVLNEVVADTFKSVAKEMPVWIVETQGNAGFIDQSRKEVCNVITTFPSKKGESVADLAERIIYALDEHHDEHSQDDPYDTLLVFGLTLAESKKEAFLNVGFSKFEETDFGFVARKLS